VFQKLKAAPSFAPSRRTRLPLSFLLLSLPFLFFPPLSFTQLLLRPLLCSLFSVDFLESALLLGPAAIFHFDPGLFDAFALHVHSAAFVAKVELALAGHVITALVLLHPKFALGTLLEFLALDEGHEFLVVFRGSGTDLVLLAGHILVPLDSAVETILFFALQALKSFGIVLLVEKHVAAVGSGAPGN